MAVSTTGYDQSVRQLLQGKGVDNSAIGYNNGYVTVNGQNFIKPAKTYNNTAYDSTQNFNNAWNTYQQSLKQPTATTSTPTATTPSYSPTAGSAITAGSNYAQNNTPTSTTSTYNPYSTSNPYDKQYSDLLSSLLQQAQNPTSVNVNDIYNSPQYAAEQAQAQKQAQQAIRAAQESFGASGFGRSSELAQSAQGIQNDANTYLQTQVLPQLVAQAQNERQQQLQNQLSLLGQLQQAQGTYDTRYNNAQDLALQKGQLTGNYVDPATSALINQILQDKQNYAAATTPEARAQASADANSVRSQLAAMGIDPSLFGADQTLAQAQGNLSRTGTPTLAAQQQAYQEARDKIADERYKQKFDEDVRQFDLNYAVDQAVKNHQMSIDDANLALQRSQEARLAANAAADNALAREKFDYEKKQDAASGGSGSSGKVPVNDIYAEAITNLDGMTPDQRKQFFQGEKSNIIKQLGLSGYNQLYGQYFDEDGEPIQ